MWYTWYARSPGSIWEPDGGEFDSGRDAHAHLVEEVRSLSENYNDYPPLITAILVAQAKRLAPGEAFPIPWKGSTPWLVAYTEGGKPPAPTKEGDYPSSD